MLHYLQVGPDWSSQIAAIRKAHSEDTNLVRFGNDFYRTCKDSPSSFQISLFPGDGRHGEPLIFEMREKDFYVTELSGVSMGRYASTLDCETPSASNLNHAVRSLAKKTTTGQHAFGLRSLVVFCVAESIRNDHLATVLEQTIRASSGRLLGVQTKLSVTTWWRIAHQWGQTSDAIYRVLRPEVATIIDKPRALMTTPERRIMQYIDLAKLPAHLQRCAATTKVLKRQT